MDEKVCNLHFSMTVLKLISIKRKRSQPEQTDLAVYCIILANVSTCSWQKAGRTVFLKEYNCHVYLLSCVSPLTSVRWVHGTHLDLSMVSEI